MAATDDTNRFLRKMNFRNIRIVLVETTHPGNIGAAARAMKTMGLERLTLVKPSRFPHAEATARAVGGDDILAGTQVVENLPSALLDCGLVIGTSARRRHLSGPSLNPRQCAALTADYSEHCKVALVFGRERNGLTNAELDCCHSLVHIPTNPEYSSLNLAAAVQVLCYEMRMAATPSDSVVAPKGDSLPAPAQEMELFYDHLERVLVEIDFLDPVNPRRIMRRLRRMFGRALPDQNEINILRGILSAVQRRKNIPS